MKMKNRYLFYAIFVFLIFTACKEEEDSYMLLEGNIANLTDENFYFVTSDSTTGIKIDTIQSKKGKFTYKSTSDSIAPVLIYMEKGSTWITVWGKNKENVKISGDVNYPELITANGNDVNDLLTEFKNKNVAVIKEKCDLRDAKTTDNVSRISNLDQLLKTNVENFIKKHPSSIASLVLIQDYLVDSNQDKLDQYLSLIEGNAKNDALYKKLIAISEKYRQTVAGSPAPDFSIISTDNDTLSLQTFKDKYLLLNFEASWCTVCEKDFSDLHRIKKEFPEKKLEIVTIALDKDPEEWEKLVQEEKIDWEQVIDNYGLASEMLSLYNVGTIPNNFLIDKDGAILARDISPDSIKILLHERIKRK
jgi:peroxiredoxin